jgi:anti-sigma factor RsiW
MSNCTEYKSLLAGLLDNELTADESRQMNDHLVRCASCRADYESLRRTENKLEAISFVEVGDEAARAFWKLPYSRAVRIAGFAMILGGYAVLAVVSLITFIAEGSDGLVERLPIIAIVIGFLILLGMVIVDRVISWQTDPYKEIER